MKNGDVVLITQEYEEQDSKLVGALGVVQDTVVPSNDWPADEVPIGVSIADIGSGNERLYVIPASSLQKVGQIDVSDTTPTSEHEYWALGMHMP